MDSSHSEVERLQERVAELEELIEDNREAILEGDLRRLTAELERERNQADEDRRKLQRQIDELQRGHLDHTESRDRSTEIDDTVRAILHPLLALAAKTPPPDDVAIDNLAQLVRDEYEAMEDKLSSRQTELRITKERSDTELSKIRRERDALRVSTLR